MILLERSEATTTRLAGFYAKQMNKTDLSKDELRSKVPIVIIELLSIINHLSFDFKQALHLVLQLLAVGDTKQHKKLILKEHQTER